MFSVRTVPHAGSFPIMIPPTYFMRVIGVLRLTLVVVLCVETGCDLKTPALCAVCGVKPKPEGVTGRYNPFRATNTGFV
jgi:hypothetical protein